MIDWIVMLILAGVLIPAAVMDVRTGKVFNVLTYSAMIGGLVLSTILGAIHGSAINGLAASALAMFAALLGFGAIRMAGGLGWGDVKLMGAYGAIVASWQCLFSATVYAFVFGAILAVAVMIRHGLVKRTMSRLLGVALTAAARTSAELPDDSPRIPFAVAICLGGLLAAGEYFLGWQTPWRPADWY